jgi:hypothetical protein
MTIGQTLEAELGRALVPTATRLVGIGDIRMRSGSPACSKGCRKTVKAPTSPEGLPCFANLLTVCPIQANRFKETNIQGFAQGDLALE